MRKQNSICWQISIFEVECRKLMLMLNIVWLKKNDNDSALLSLGAKKVLLGLNGPICLTYWKGWVVEVTLLNGLKYYIIIQQQKSYETKYFQSQLKSRRAVDTLTIHTSSFNVKPQVFTIHIPLWTTQQLMKKKLERLDCCWSFLLLFKVASCPQRQLQVPPWGGDVQACSVLHG